jgi:DNA-binding IclR family transcriptional regulator
MEHRRRHCLAGASGPLRYDPDMGLSIDLCCSAAGHARLSTMSDEDASASVAGSAMFERRA